MQQQNQHQILQMAKVIRSVVSPRNCPFSISCWITFVLLGVRPTSNPCRSSIHFQTGEIEFYPL